MSTAWIEHDLPGAARGGCARDRVDVGHTVEDFAARRELLRPAVDELVAIEVNVSCPNLQQRSEMFAHDPDATAGVVRAVVDVGLGLPVFAKLSPNVTDLTRSRGAAVDAGATGLTLVNTVLGLLVDAETRRPVLGGGGGGLSGPAIKPVALRAVHDVTRALPGRSRDRHRRCAVGSRRGRDVARGRDRGRRRHRELPRSACSVPRARRARRLVRATRRRARAGSHRCNGG